MSAAEVAVAAFEDPPPPHAATISEMAASETMAPDLMLRTDCLPERMLWTIAWPTVSRRPSR
jgi:hypothetical protein